MIAIVDYGLGNVKAFENVYKKLSIPVISARTVADLETSDRFILPGVGSFDSAMDKFNQSGMREKLEELVLKARKPVLGICVGMQMLAHGSEEGVKPGLGWIDGYVRKLDASSIPYHTKLPHMGWNDVEHKRPSSLLKDMGSSSLFYFLHSYYFDCKSAEDVVATANYGSEFAAIVNHGNVYGIQCHPEKSHECGISILKNFSEV